MSGTPFNMDMAVQVAQTQGFQGLVDSAQANNNQMLVVADSALGANRGQMSDAFQTWLEEVQHTATQNNQVLDSIREALHFGIGSTDNTDAEHAGTFTQLTGSIGSGAHFN